METRSENSILIVEDESLVALDIERTLRKKGYSVCGCADNAEEAIEMAERYGPALVLMDVSLYGTVDGIEAAKIMKEKFGMSVIFITAYSDDKTIAQATSLEPDGYLVKPFNQGTLLAAVRLAMRKYLSAENKYVSTVYETLCGRCVYQMESGKLLCDEKEVYLTRKERKLLELLIHHRGHIVPFERIDMELWPEKAVSETTRRTLLHRLRKKMGGEALETVIGTGCRLHVKERR